MIGSKSIALRNAESTLEFAKKIIQPIESQELSIAIRQGDELVRFIKAFTSDLEKHLEKARTDRNDFSLQLLLSRQQQLEEALQFVEQAFVAPRFQHKNQQFLEAADWICVEGFHQYFDGGRKGCNGGKTESTLGPIGPLVAVDARRSPAVWEPGASLPLPSLFQRQPQQFARSSETDEATRSLAYFPVICLPNAVARLPEFYPLLSHEVGHAVDFTLGLSNKIVATLPKANKNYWEAWMREIVADAIGLALSGEAFALSLMNFVRFLSISNSISDRSPYPSVSLRLAMLEEELLDLNSVPSQMEKDLKPNSLPPEVHDFLVQFRESVWPQVKESCLLDIECWREEQRRCRELAHKLVDSHQSAATFIWPNNDFEFRLAPSVVALASEEAIRNEKSLDTLDAFRKIHQEIPESARPAWIKSPSNWKFPLEVLSSLRPTFVAADGQSKIPPPSLIGFHDHIAFVGATHRQLIDKLKFAHQAGKCWSSLEFFFGSDLLLSKVERYPAEDLLTERNQAQADLLEFLRDPSIAESWTIYEFDTPLVFGAYWDWDQPGGRIHISSQILGTDLRKCPAVDFVWTDEVPPVHYESYRMHLRHLRRNAKEIESSKR